MRKLFALLLITACSSGSTAAPSTDPTPPRGDAATDPPVVVDDGDDAGTPKKDAGKDAAGDAGGDDILGTLMDGCGGNMSAELTNTAPSFLNDELAFVAGESFTKPFLSPGGQILFDVPNAGGSSFESEAMSFEVLHACAGASLLKTETEIGYDPPSSKKTDILVEIGGKKVGVSVTRVYRPSTQTLTDADAQSQLEGKLDDILVSSANAVAGDKWVKQVLHIFTASQAATDAVARVVPNIAPAKRADTIIFVTHTTGGGFIYCNPDPPLGSECP